MSYLAPVKPSLGQLRLDLSRRLAEATVTGTDVNLEGIDYFIYAPAEMAEVIAEFESYTHKITETDWPRFLRLMHRDLRRRGYVYSNWDAKTPDLVVKSLSDYLLSRR
jgi:hypothetical protein